MGPPKSAQDTTTRSYTVACVLMSLLKLPAAWFQLSIIFFAPDINFSCISELNKNETNLNLTYDLDWNRACYVELNDSLKCEQWRYDTSQYTRSIVHEWDLVCDQSYGSVIAQSSFFVGILFGNIAFHLMAERIGRKGPLMLSLLIQAFGSVLVGLSHTFITFLIYRLILGVGLGGTIVISGKLGNELVSKKLRVPVSLMTQIPFGLGQGVLALTAFFLRDWRDVNIAISIYSFAFVLYYWLVPESSKWLVENEKRRKLKFVTNASQTSFDKAKNDSTLIGETFTQPVAAKKVTIMSLLEGSTLRRYTISIFAMSFFAGVCFFSMNQYQAKLGSDVFFNIGIGGIIGGVPGNIASVYFINTFGRKATVIVSHVFAGLPVMFVPTILLDSFVENWPRRLLGLVTVMGMSVSYPALFLYCAELVDVRVRKKVMYLSLLWHRLGSIVAPFVGATATINYWLPAFIIGILPLFTSLIMLTLPEVNGLPEDNPQPTKLERYQETREDPEAMKCLSETNTETKI